MSSFHKAMQSFSRGETGPEALLAEIVRTQGSVPRGEGAAMLLDRFGRFYGTVGGGSVEYIAQKKMRALWGRCDREEETYSLGGDQEGVDTGMLCGGAVTIRFCRITPEDASLWLQGHRAPTRIYIYGAGHVGKALAALLSLQEYSITICDDREALLTEESFPGAERILCPDMTAAPLPAGAGDLIAIMTHGHTYDLALLRRAMKTPARYIGVLAGHKKAEAALRVLREDGFSEQEISARVHTPIGLAIGAETPEEIAVSIAAELIRLLRAET